MEERLLLDESGRVEAPGAEAHRRHKSEKSLTGSEGTFVGEAQKLLAAVRRKGGAGVVPLSQPFLLRGSIRGHAYPPGPIRRSSGLIIYDRRPFINFLVACIDFLPGFPS